MSNEEQTKRTEVLEVKEGSPLHSLLSLYSALPDELGQYMLGELDEFVNTTTHRLLSLSTFGTYMPSDENNSLEEVFAEAMEEAGEIGLKGALLDGALEIAAAVDRTVTRHMITAVNENYRNRQAHLDIIAGHAILMRGIKNLDNVPADFDGSSDDEETDVRKAS